MEKRKKGLNVVVIQDNAHHLNLIICLHRSYSVHDGLEMKFSIRSSLLLLLRTMAMDYGNAKLIC